MPDDLFAFDEDSDVVQTLEPAEDDAPVDEDAVEGISEDGGSESVLDFARGVDIEELKAPSIYCCCHPNNPATSGYRTMWKPSGPLLHDPKIFNGQGYKMCANCGKIVWQHRTRKLPIPGEFDSKGNPFTLEFDALHPDQEVLAQKLTDFTYLVVLCGRRFGKSLWANQMLIELAIRYPGCTIMWVANTLSSARMVSRDVLGNLLQGIKLSNGELFFSINKSSDEAKIVAYRNPNRRTVYSKILWRSAEAPLNIQGVLPGPDFFFLDECQHMPQVTWSDPETGEAYVKPASDDRDAKVVFLGYSIGINWFSSLFEEARLKMDGIKTDEPDSKDWAIHRASSWKNPLYPEKRRLTALRLPRASLWNLYLAVPTVGGTGLFENLEIRDEKNPKGVIVAQDTEIKYSSSRYMGIDLGISRDYTVILTVDAMAQLVNIVRFHKQNINFIKEAIIDEWIKQGSPEIMLDASSGGNGQAIMEALDGAGIPYHYVHISNTEKRNLIISRVMEACSEGFLVLPEGVPFVRHLLEEMTSLAQVVENNKSKYVSQGQRKGKRVVGAHDDIILALGLSLDILYANEVIRKIPDHLLERAAAIQGELLDLVKGRPAVYHQAGPQVYSTDSHLQPYSTQERTPPRYIPG